MKRHELMRGVRQSHRRLDGRTVSQSMIPTTSVPSNTRFHGAKS